MYLVNQNNVITITRGDNLKLPIKLITSSFPTELIYELEENDIMYFGIMEPHQAFENAIVKKTYTYKDEDSSGTVVVEITPDDTLFLNPGTYYYAVKVLSETGDKDNARIDTIIQKTKFIIID